MKKELIYQIRKKQINKYKLIEYNFYERLERI